jgi:hypothetical protein
MGNGITIFNTSKKYIYETISKIKKKWLKKDMQMKEKLEKEKALLVKKADLAFKKWVELRNKCEIADEMLSALDKKYTYEVTVRKPNVYYKAN